MAQCVHVWRHVRDASHRTAEEDELAVLSRANCMHSDAASQGGSWWQGGGAAYHASTHGTPSALPVHCFIATPPGPRGP